jgi:hypothetical protein
MIQCRVAYQSPRSIEGVYGPGLTQFIGRAVSRLCPEWVNNGPDGSATSLLVYPEQRTRRDRLGWSVQCQ